MPVPFAAASLARAANMTRAFSGPGGAMTLANRGVARIPPKPPPTARGNPSGGSGKNPGGNYNWGYGVGKLKKGGGGGGGGSDRGDKWWSPSTWWQYDSFLSRVDSAFPSQIRIAEIVVGGGPHSDIQSVYYLALSVAFGVVSRTVAASDCAIDIKIDYTALMVVVKLVYSYHGGPANVQSQFSSDSGAQLIRQPPLKEIRGDNWPPFLSGANFQKPQAGSNQVGIQSFFPGTTTYQLLPNGNKRQVTSQSLPGASEVSNFLEECIKGKVFDWDEAADMANGVEKKRNPIVTLNSVDFNYKPNDNNLSEDLNPLFIISQALSQVGEQPKKPKNVFNPKHALKNPSPTIPNLSGYDTEKSTPVITYESRFSGYLNNS